MKPPKPKRTARDVIKDPVSGPGTMRARLKYMNTPQVQRALSIERAEKQKPIVDVPRQKKKTPKPPTERRNSKNEDIFGEEGLPRKR